MQRITVLIWTLSNLIQLSFGACPQAKFQFYNQTKWATYNFVDSSVGNIGSLETCPYTGRPYVYLPCYTNSSWGNEPYFSNCLKPSTTTTTTTIMTTVAMVNTPPTIVSLDEIARFPINTSEAIAIVLDYLNDERLPLNSSLHLASMIDIIHRISVTHPQADVLVHSNFYSIVNKLLSSLSTLQVRSAEQNNRSITQLVSSLDDTVQNLVVDQPDISFIQENLAVSLIHQPSTRTKPVIGFAYDPTRNAVLPISVDDAVVNLTSIVLTPRAAANQNRLIFSTFHQRNGLFDDDHSRLLTPMVSLMIDKPQTALNIGAVLKVDFQVEDSFSETNRSLKCAYWNLWANHTARWLTDGCQLTNRTKNSVTCMCEYRTHLAVLMDNEPNSTPRLIEQMLSIITLIGLALSSIGLCLTILTFTFFKKLRRHFSQKSLLLLSINILFVNILFALIDLYTRSQFKDLLCVVIASFLHYFILSTFSWMLVLALIQYLLFVKVFPRAVSAFTRKAAAFAQLAPLIPVVVVLVVDPWNSTKRTDQICWLSSLPFYLSFILPIGLCILIIGILFFIVAHSFFCGKTGRHVRSHQMAEPHRRSRFSIAFCCFLALTLTWIFGLFAIGPIRLVLQILFCIFASLASFLIFLLYLITSKAKRPYWNNTLKSLGIPTIYSPTSSSSSGFLSTREFSISSNSDHQKLPARRPHVGSQTQHFIDAYMPSSPPPPAPPVQPPLLMEGDDSLHPTSMTHQFYEPRHVWAPQTNYIYETNQPTTSLDDYSLFYASHHNATKL